MEYLGEGDSHGRHGIVSADIEFDQLFDECVDVLSGEEAIEDELSDTGVHSGGALTSRPRAPAGIGGFCTNRAVVLGALLGVDQGLVYQVELLEPLDGSGVRVAVRVVYEGLLAVGAPDLVAGCGPRDAEDLVVVAAGQIAGSLADDFAYGCGVDVSAGQFLDDAICICAGV